MPGRSNRSARVVLCDDVSWSEPAPRGRRTAAELDPPSWAAGPEDVIDLDVEPGHHVTHARETSRGRHVEDRDWDADLAWHAADPPRTRGRSEARFAPSASGGRTDALSARHAARTERARAASGHRVEDYLGAEGWLDALEGSAPVVDYTDAVGDGVDEERIWGPRPRLHADEPGGRRTVVITGRGSDRYVTPRAPRGGSLPLQVRHGFAADRTAMWAVLLCVIVLLVALGTH